MFSLSRRALLPAALLLALVAAPEAQADTVPCSTIPAIDDGQGGVWYGPGTGTPAAAGAIGALEIAVTNGAASSADAYDNFGALIVGTTKYDASGQNCERTVSSGVATIRYPELASASGLLVRRSLTFRAYSTGSHYIHIATLNNIVRNPTGAPIVADISVGDGTGAAGSLGSGLATNVITTSSGDAAVTAADNWAITADAPAGSAGGDPVLFHGWNQTYIGADRAEEVGAVGATAADDWRSKWTGVSVAAGATASFQTVEGVDLTNPKDVNTAVTELQNRSSFPLLYTGYLFGGPTLTVPEIAGSRNMQVPQVSVDNPAPDRAAVGEPVQLVLKATSNDVPQCSTVTGSLTYSGTAVLSANGRVTTAGIQGTHPYSATASNNCGQSTTKTGSTVVDGTTTSCNHLLAGGGGIPLFDSTGAAYDPQSDGSLADGGFLDPLLTDSYDGIDELTVGGTAFNPPSSNGCQLEAGGRQIRTASQAVGGLNVSRTTYVANGGAGARLAITLSNPTGAPITTGLLVGSTGALGSDDATVVTATGDGAATPTPASRWMATDDTPDGGNDAALAHVWDGAGGADSADSVVLTDPAHPADHDDYEVKYDNVTVPAGGQATYILWEAQRRRNPRAEGERADAAAAGAALAASSGNDLYGGMTAAEIASVRNWAHPAPTGTLSGPASGLTGTPQTFTLTGVAGGAGVAQCGAGAVAWTVDGAAVPGAAQITPTFATVGAHTVTATITGDCAGGSLVRTATFTASKAVVPPPVATVKLSGLKLTGACLTAPKRKVTIKVGATVAVATKVTLKIQKLVGKPKTCVKATSKAGVKLLKAKGAKTAYTKSGKVVKGKVSFTVPARTVKTGTAKLVKGVLVLPRGAYRVVLSAGTKTVATLLIVK